MFKNIFKKIIPLAATAGIEYMAGGSGGNLFARKHKEFLMKEYVDNERSTYDLAKELGTYPNKISRALKALGVPMRDKSSAQSAALSSGRHKHPTKGKKRSEAT